MVLIIAILVSIPLAIGVMAGLAYYTTGEGAVPSLKVTVMGEDLAPMAYSWHEPVFGGLLYRQFTKMAGEEGEAADIGALENPYIEFAVPEGQNPTVEFLRGGSVIWTGSPEEAAAYQFVDNGSYDMHLVFATEPGEVRGGYGSIEYGCAFRVAVEPRLEASEEWVAQGDTVAIRVFNLKDGDEVSAECALGDIHFVPSGSGTVTGYVPVGHAREPGDYNAVVRTGGYEWEVSIRVIETNFKVENIVVAAEDAPVVEEGQEVPNVGQAPPEDYGEYHEKIRPLFEEWDNEMHWEGLFEMPVKGVITVDYGLLTYSTGSARQLQQSGIGIAADAGTPVFAPGNGRVVFVEDMRDSGLSMVIEHGGGLKSLLFFLGEADAKVGDFVVAGQEIGKVGTGGFSDNASVYYEVRVGYETLNPMMVFDGASKLYYFNNREPAGAQASNG